MEVCDLHSRSRRLTLVAIFLTMLPATLNGIAGSRISAADWPQWGRTLSRNGDCMDTGLPASFEPGRKKPGGGIKMETARNVKWAARLGSAAYGNPTVAAGRVFVGTDDVTLAADRRFKRTRGGLVKCLSEATGELLWQLVVPVREKGLPDDAHFGHQHLGICSSAAVDGERAYVLTSAGDFVCLDVDGQADGNDGPFRDESRYMAGADNPPVELKATDADIVWRYDPIDELGVCPHDAVASSALVHGDLIYVGTSNGLGGKRGGHNFPVSPLAPSLIVLDKKNGRLVAVDDAKMGKRMYHGLWSSPSLGRVGGRTLIFYGGGDGVCYAFEAIEKSADKPQRLRTVWTYDCNPREYKLRDGKPVAYYAGDKRKRNSPNKNDGSYVGPSQIIATPVFHKGRVYVAIGQDPAHGRGSGMLHCIDASQTGDITETGKVWSYDGIERSISTVAVDDKVLYVPDVSGKLHCLDADTGECHWVYDTGAETWGGVLVGDGKLYLGNKRHFCVFSAGKEQPKVLSKVRLGSPAYSTPIAANGVVYVTSQRYLWAVARVELPADES